MAQGIDAHYWEHKSEIACQAKTNPQSSSLSKQSSTGGSSSKQSSPSSSTSSSSSTGRGKKPQCPSSSTRIIGKDGKLTAMECLHHMKNSLCLFCGLPGHSAKDCPRSTSHMAKACAAQAASIAASTAETPAEAKKYPNSLKPVVYIPDYDVSDVIALLGSGSSHCFIDPVFVKTHNILVEEISLIPLHLFDGTCNSFITHWLSIGPYFKEYG
ncbi:hypothetical protein ID866_12829 [Astraeus odoratus]|nr:hypothetical protein ID866_12829 [Astraeus odoratus]